MTDITSFNYASAFGIRSLAAAVVFAVLYAPLLVFFLAKTISRPIYVYFILTLFSAIRVTAFILRALLSRDASVADNLQVFIAYEILYNAGFFGLLYSAYTLVNARVRLAKNPPTNPISRLLRHRILFRLGLATAVALGIAGATQSSSGATPSAIAIGTTLREVAIYIFLVGVFLVLLQTSFLAIAEFSDGGHHPSGDRRIGTTHGTRILFVISLLLLIREVFFVATANRLSRQNNEAYWYPFTVVTEYLAVLLFAVPGLVPDTPKET